MPRAECGAIGVALDAPVTDEDLGLQQRVDLLDGGQLLRYCTILVDLCSGIERFSWFVCRILSLVVQLQPRHAPGSEGSRPRATASTRLWWSRSVWSA